MKTSFRAALLLAIAGICPSCKFLARQIVPHLERWGNGLTKREGRLEGGLQTGEWTYYYESGQRRAYGRYTDDHQTGPWTYWFENGGIEWSGAFDASGKRTGEWTFFYPDSTMRARGRYIADFEDGPWEFFGEDGALDRKGQYDGGKLSGPWTYYQGAGRPKAEGICHRGQRIGPWRVWDASGTESVQDFGTRPGISIAREQWPNGSHRRAGVLQNGAPVGRWTSWHDNGALRFCCTLQDGRPCGVFEARNPAGDVLAQGVLAAGAFVEGSIGVENGATRPLAAAAVPAPAAATADGVADWVAAEALAALAPEQAVAVLGAELARPVDATAITARADAPAVPPPPAAAAVVRQIEQESERIPAPVQPSRTVLQEQETEDYVQNYLEGPSKTRPSLRKYGPATGAKSTGSSAGPRRRADLEGKPVPIDVLKGVDGTDVDLRQYRGKKRVLLVVLRGFLGEVCIYCVAQTEALARCREDLADLGIEVLVVYPGAKENEESFERAYDMTFGKGAPPYKVFYDPDLTVVQKLGITGDLAFPTTLIIDEQGIVQYAYVGEHRADRPAARELIRVIKGLKK
ncbi:MAG: redoxin family protein [Planctomycetes bacterium]|nr:redoxin family protein [Planctomycetota bacterium]